MILLSLLCACVWLPSPTFEPAQLAVDDGPVHERTDVGPIGVDHLNTEHHAHAKVWETHRMRSVGHRLNA
jgi:hypothetical protein|eukprot:COSAG03_NODE_416_length_8086_cov_5.782772_7_plen_70_part_00